MVVSRTSRTGQNGKLYNTWKGSLDFDGAMYILLVTLLKLFVDEIQLLKPTGHHVGSEFHRYSQFHLT